MANLLSVLCAAIAVVAVSAEHASAQAVGPPTADTGGLFGRRASRDPRAFSQELTLTFGGAAGFDQITDSDGTPLPPVATGAVQSGAVSLVEGALAHSVGRTGKLLTTSVRGYANYASQGVRRIVGGSAALQGQLPLGRRAGLTANGALSYDPTFLFGAFGPVESLEGATAPTSSPSQGISDNSWVTLAGTAGIYHNWTRRQRTDGSLGLTDLRSRSMPAFGYKSDAATLRHSWAPTARVTFDMGYRYGDQMQSASGVSNSLNTQAVEASVHLERRLSPTKRLMLSLGGGATYARAELAGVEDTTSLVVPSYLGQATVVLSRSWQVSVDARRDVSVLRGIAPEPFATDLLSLRIAGAPFERLQLNLSGGVLRGAAQVAENGSYAVATGTAQMLLALTRYSALATSYSYYNHDFVNVATQDSQFPNSFARNSLRVGLSVWLPLVGRF